MINDLITGLIIGVSFGFLSAFAGERIKYGVVALAFIISAIFIMWGE